MESGGGGLVSAGGGATVVSVGGGLEVSGIVSAGGEAAVEVPVSVVVVVVAGSNSGTETSGAAMEVVLSAVEVNTLGFFTAKAVQLKFISVGAALFKRIVNPFTLFLVTIYCTFAEKMMSSLPEFSIEIVVFTIGCSKYSWAKATSTDLSPLFMSANPAVSWLRYGLPIKTTSLWRLMASFKEEMWSMVNPWDVIWGVTISTAAPSRSVSISDCTFALASRSFPRIVLERLKLEVAAKSGGKRDMKDGPL